MMNEINQDLPFSADKHSYKLDKLSLKRWWRSLIGPGEKTTVVFLLTSPFSFALLFYINKENALKVLPILIIVCLILFSLMLRAIHKHLKHIIEATTTKKELELRSYFFRRTIPWVEILDFFPVQDNQYLLLTKNDEYFLSASLASNKELVTYIENKIRRIHQTYDWSFRIPPDYFNSLLNAGIACLIMLSVAIYLGLTSEHPVTLTAEDWLVLTFFLTISAVAFIQFFKMPTLIRANQSGLFLRFGQRIEVLKWEQIKAIKKLFPKTFIICTNSRWFIFPAGFLPAEYDLKGLLSVHKEKLLLSKSKTDVIEK